MRLRSVAAVVSVGLAFLGACGDDAESPSTPSTSAGATTSTVPSVTTPGEQSYVDSGDYETGLHLVKITKFDRTARTVTYDAVQFLTGDAARAAYEEDLGETPDTDYYVRNQNTQVRTAKLAADAEFRVNNLGGYPPAEPDDGHEVDFDTFASYFDGEQAFASYFWVRLEASTVVAVEEQYLP